MNPRKIPALLLTTGRLLACAAALITTAVAQSTSTGTIEGRVLNTTTSSYINNARVTVEGTTLETYTNQSGEYRLINVPPGAARLTVLFSGLPPQNETVTVAAGQTVQQNFFLVLEQKSANQAARDLGTVVQLDQFTVGTTRETNATNIATNEQRFASNIKNVVSSDAFGDVTEGNVGEFVKYLPGITVDYVAADVRTISVRGFADNFTNVTSDGARMASSASGSTIRTFELEQVSINNVSRVEVTKVPTPDQAADSLGGSVNMVSRSAFESATTQFKYRFYTSFNSEDYQVFKKTPGPGNKDTFKVLPGFDFNYIAPLSKTFGLVINGLSSNQFNEQHRAQPTWRFVGAGATVTNPYLRQFQVQDGPKNTFRDSFSIKADWKPARYHVISASAQVNYYHSFFANRNTNFDVGSSEVPTPATGTPLTFGPSFAYGATGRGTVTQGGSFRDKYGATRATNLNHTYKGREWEIDSGLNASISKTWYRTNARGHFSGVNTSLVGVSRVLYDGITYPVPAKFTALDSAGVPIDYNNPANYRLTTLGNTPVDARDEFRAGRVNVKRALSFLPVEATLKIGGLMQKQKRDITSHNESTTFVGRDGVANTADDSLAPYVDTKYLGQDNGYGFTRLPFGDAYRLWEETKTNPGYFSTTPAQAVTNETNRINGSLQFAEKITAGYAQFEGRFFKNRLGVVTGVRYEKTEDTGRGPLVDPDAPFVRGADGKFTLVNGARVRKTEAGAAGSLQELALIRRERAAFADRSYDGYYPSLHTTFNVTDNVLFRAAFAKTFGRPDLGSIIPNTTIDENDNPNPPAGSPPGTITFTNSGLRPYSAKNYDFSLEYYFPKGGLISAGVFRKDLRDFFGSINTVATAAVLDQLGLDQRYVGWTVNSRLNVGSARIDGAEFNYMQPLSSIEFLPRWGRFFNFSASGSILHLQGANGADFNRFIPKSGSMGLTFSRKPVVLMVKYNYRGRQRNSAQSGTAPNAFEYYDSRYNIDVNAEYTFSRRVTIFANARNILNTPQDLERYSPETPGYTHTYRTEEFGVQFALGVKGTF
ncbi:TonB-dependent receptor [Horticoccus sp. 23ND18S-11]|uniref:TonB-dependent receptor n=1 Tax=Horticoccus sp. 23ND18S-11 TaxID=3391832 RepID=UPI0039C98B2C